ncbi:DNA-binding transcriptional regulator, ArsR family [Streptomyces sp. 2112.2]|nr:DNA-binding transcriptional regulator, ArsR family [Streptomyces sp. 2314.4]SED66980.1 DNA-binding transcriptional regulator, ArsR family [Streptomyces sp. 2112.2]
MTTGEGTGRGAGRGPVGDAGRGSGAGEARDSVGDAGRGSGASGGRDSVGNAGRDSVGNAGRDSGAGGDAVAEVFSALADPTRRRILDALAAHGEATATVLAAELPVSRQAVVKHLGVLDRAGLVAGHREGREARYRVIPERLGVTARWMDRVAAAWDSRLSAIKRLAEGE